jgi:hypothetical protein
MSETINPHGRVLIRMPACYVGLLADVLEEKGIEMRLHSRDDGAYDLHVRRLPYSVIPSRPARA